jgi:hypothetical protein
MPQKINDAMPESIQIDTMLVQQWALNKTSPQLIESELREKGFDTAAISGYLAEFKRLRNAKKQFKGFACMGAGALLGFISLVLSLTNPFPGMYDFFLFGLTSVAVLVVFLGLYLVFE